MSPFAIHTFQRLNKNENTAHHQTETFEVAKGSCHHARDARDGFQKKNSLESVRRVRA